MLEVDDPVFEEWWTKYPGFDDCCGECPGCCAIKYENNTESPKDPSSVVLAMGQGNQPAVRIQTANPG